MSQFGYIEHNGVINDMLNFETFPNAFLLLFQVKIARKREKERGFVCNAKSLFTCNTGTKCLLIINFLQDVNFRWLGWVYGTNID